MRGNLQAEHGDNLRASLNRAAVSVIHTARRAHYCAYVMMLDMTKTLSRKQVGVLGAHATNSKLSPEQRSKNARKAAKARWAKHHAV
jgi:hypothetical protein